MSSQLGLPLLLSVAVVVAVAAFSLWPVSPPDPSLVVALASMALGLAGLVQALALAIQSQKKHRRRAAWTSHNDDDPHTIRTVEELRELMPAGASGTCLEDAKKVIDHLDGQMTDFVSRSPLLYLATVDATTGAPFVSPKGDEPGFVTVLETSTGSEPPRHTLVIPDRPGNRLLFGLQNILGHTNDHKRESTSETVSQPSTTTTTTPQRGLPRVSVLFEVPGTGSTLRCGGTARLSKDPDLLARHTARGCPPRLVILVDVDHAFFHCAKAYMRSRVWDPASWASPPFKVTFGRYFAKKDGLLAKTIDSGVDKHYQEVQKAIDGEACEKEA